METYNFYNKKTGLEIQLEYYKNPERIIYKCFGLNDNERGVLRYTASNGWVIHSWDAPELRLDIIYVRGGWEEEDDNVTVLAKYNTDESIINSYRDHYRYRLGKIVTTHKNIRVVYEEIKFALEEFDGTTKKNQGLLFLEM